MLRNYRIYLLGAFALLASSCHSSTTPPPVAAPPSFAVTPLTANKAIYGAANIDTNMQDSWGLAFNPSNGYPWVANRGSGNTSILNTTGSAVNHYDVNGSNGTLGSPTGIVTDSTGSFPIAATGSAATWIFSELGGTLSAITTGGAQGKSTFLLSDESPNSSYTGLALVTGSGGAHLYAPNVRNTSLDQFGLTGQNYTRNQSSSRYPGYTPFNIVVIDTQMFVTYAKWSSSAPYFVFGSGNGGYVDIYHLDGTFEGNLISNGSLDEPWGVAIAPPSFGSYSGDLLVGNFGDGTIHAYNRSTGALMGTLNDASGAPIVINGLWALVVYNGTLYYTAGPNDGADGVFGTITVK
jgi:uncharacterized protein (TIGR03118 family)